MAGTQTAPVPFTVYKVIQASDSLPTVQRLPEKAALTIKRGTPVFLSSGYIIERTAISSVATAIVAGIVGEAGHNLTADGTAQGGMTYGSVQNQPAAVNIAIGSPFADGNIEVIEAIDETIFRGKTDAAHTVGVADIFAQYGLTKDATSGLWFVDTTIVTAATGTCVEVIELIEPGVVGGQVAFRFTKAAQQAFV